MESVKDKDEALVLSAEDWSPLRKGQQSSAERTGVLCGKDWSPLLRGLLKSQ
jgi:hypothetical protein